MSRKGGSKRGPKPEFTRVIPKFLQQYEAMLTTPKPRPEGEPDGDGEGGGEFSDYTAEEVAAMDAYRKEHPAVDAAAIRRRAKELGSRIQSGQKRAADEGGGGDSGGNVKGAGQRKPGGGDTAAAAAVAALEAQQQQQQPEEEDVEEEPREYVDASGMPKFNLKAGATGAAATAAEAGRAGKKRRRRERPAVKKLDNKLLLSFEEGDGEG